jgi:hypothetical protein
MTKLKIIPFNVFKPIIDPVNVELIQHHIPFGCYEKSCRAFMVPYSAAQTSHYRNKAKRSGQNGTIDKTVWKFKNQLMMEVNKTLRETHFVP